MIAIDDIDAALATSWRIVDRRIALGASDLTLLRRETAELHALCERLREQIAALQVTPSERSECPK